MKFENILEEIDGFGKFQLILLVILVLSRIVLPCHFLLNNFIAAVPSHHCDLSALDNVFFRNLTVEQRLTVSVPVGEDGSPKSCEMFAEPQFELSANGSNSTDFSTIPCQSGWVYDQSTFSSTLTTEWDMVCDNKYLSRTLSTVLFVGVMLGATVFGYLADKYGRRSTLLASFVIALVFSFGSAFANSYLMFAVLRFLTGFGLSGIVGNSLVLSIEWVDTDHRSFNSVIGSLSWSLGNILLAGIAYLVRDWRGLIMAVTSPLILAVLTWWWIPESARWLLVTGKVEKAQFYLDRCAKVNKRKKLSNDTIQQTASSMKSSEKKGKNYSYLDLFKTPKLRQLSVLTGFTWFGLALTYYGISLNIDGFGLSIYLTHFIYAVIELPAKLITFWLLNVIGRRRCQSGALTLTGVCIAAQMVIPKDLWQVRTVVAVFGKGLSESSFTTIYLYTTELFPTVLRQNGIGFTSFMCRLGVSIAPLILMLEDLWTPLPQTISCCIVTISGFLCLLLPETLNVKLPETIDDIERKTHVSSPSTEPPGVKELESLCNP